jgi:predicted metal-dependent TIM-barrel fold hydrolase
MSYIENFLGLGTVILDSNIDSGYVIGTAKENLEVIGASIEEIPDMDLRTDESGILAVHNDAAYANGAVETVVYTGLCVKPDYLDRVFKVQITSAEG